MLNLVMFYSSNTNLLTNTQISHYPSSFSPRLNTAATTETLVSIMKGMGQVMKQGNEAIDIKNIQMAIEVFSIESEKQNIMQG